MMILITYDVSTESAEGRNRLRKVAKQCVNYGIRVQNSVFECKLNAAQYVVVKDELLKLINLKEDSIRFYKLGSNYEKQIEHYGIKETINIDKPVIF